MGRSRDEDEEEEDEDDRPRRQIRLPRPRIRVKAIGDMEEHLETLHDKLDAIIAHLEEEADEDDDDGGGGGIGDWITADQKALMAEHVVKPLMVQLAQALARPDGLAELFTVAVNKLKDALMGAKGSE